MSTDVVLKEGELIHIKSKKGIFESWTSKRYAVLTKSKLSFYKDQKNYEAKKDEPVYQVLIDKNTQLDKVDELHKIKFVGHMRHFAVEEHFGADNEDDYDSWANQIEELIEIYQAGRKYLTNEEMKLLNAGDARETYRLISNALVNIDAIVKDPSIESEEDKELKEMGFETHPKYDEKDISKDEDGTTLIYGYPHGSTMFHIAVHLGEKDLIRKVLDNKKSKPDLDIQDSRGETPLHVLNHMLRNKDTQDEISGMLLDLHSNVNIKDKNNKTALLLACEQESWKYVTKLIFDGKADINLVPNVATPLHHVVKFREMTTLRSLLKLQADVHVLDSEGNTPIDISAQKKDKEVTLMLLKHDPNIDAKRDNAKHYIPLLIELNEINKIKEIIDQHEENANYEWEHPEAKIAKCSLIAGAIEQGSLELVKVLIDNYKVNVNAPIEKEISTPGHPNEIHSYTPLHLAIMKNQPELIKILIDVGADCKIVTEPEKLSPLMLACKNKLDIETIKFLLSNKDVDVNVLAGDGSNLLHFAASTNNIDLFKEFVSKGLDIKNTTEKKQTVVSAACLSGSFEMTKYLIEELGLDIRGSGEEDFITDSYPPLHCAVISGNPFLVEYLLEKSVELLGDSIVNQCNIDGQMRAIHLAALNGKKEITQLLIEKKCDLSTTIQISGDKGVNPLHLACGYGHLEIIKLLLDAGMDVNAVTTVTKSTPVHFALKRMQIEVVKFLQDKGAASDGVALQLAVQTGQVELLDVLDKMVSKSPRALIEFDTEEKKEE
eukprot:gene6574-10737_t